MLFEKKKYLFYSLLDFTVHSALKRSKYLLNLGGSTAKYTNIKTYRITSRLFENYMYMYILYMYINTLGDISVLNYSKKSLWKLLHMIYIAVLKNKYFDVIIQEMYISFILWWL